jgi:prepilin-type N-terminal cleavage/methylation domain-containing protein
MLKRSAAFTLVELMVVVAIVVILSRIGLVKYYGSIEKARSAEAYLVLADIAAAETGYYAENDVYTANWSKLDRYNAAPKSGNFNFTTALDTVASGYVQAIATKGTVNYYMCVNGANKSASSAPACS